jgi:hypothetical protein
MTWEKEYLDDCIIAKLPDKDEKPIFVKHDQNEIEHRENDERLKNLERLAVHEGNVPMEHHVEGVQGQNPAHRDQRHLIGSKARAF